MKPNRGYYALIQYCPDLSRLETANIGVLLFCPELNFLKAQTSEIKSRVLNFFGLTKKERTRIESFAESIVERLKTERKSFQTLEDLERFIATRANAIQITAPRPMKVYEPEKDLQQLYEELVIKVEKKQDEALMLDKTNEPIRKIEQKISQVLENQDVRQFIRKDASIEVPALHKKITVPFAFQNGHFNLIKPVYFESKRQDTLIKEACVYAVEGHSIARHSDPDYGDSRLMIVGQLAQEKKSAQDVVKNILSENEVRLFSLDELNELHNEILTTGKAVDGGI